MKNKKEDLIPGKKVKGLRQVIRGIKDDNIRCVIVALDADEDIKNQVIRACSAGNIPIEYERSIIELGNAVGLNIGCAVVGLLKD